MIRALPVCALLLVPTAAMAQGKEPPGETIRITLRPAVAPKPALKYQLLPELLEMNPGNPILGYLRCFSEQNPFFHGKEANDQRDRWSEMPLKDLPVKELRGYGGLALRRADDAARLDLPDWQILLRVKTEGIGLLVPELQQMRSLAHALHMRFRGEVADGRFDDALTTAKTMFALARHMGEHPSLIGKLVGNAIAHITIGNLDELIGQAGSPSLFWAIADLPSPFLDMRKGMQGERAMLDSELRFLDESGPMSEAQLTKAVARMQQLHDAMHLQKGKRDARAWLDGRARDEAHVAAARKRLVEFGLVEKKVKEFPALQVVLLDEKYGFLALRDDTMKAVALPYWQARPLFDAIPEKRSDELLLGGFGVGVNKVRTAQVRLEQRFALLRHVEALRLHAAANGGKLPKKLDDVRLPLPLDPASNRPMSYTLDGGTATLTATTPLGDAATWTVRYVITAPK